MSAGRALSGMSAWEFRVPGHRKRTTMVSTRDPGYVPAQTVTLSSLDPLEQRKEVAEADADDCPCRP